MPRQTAKQQGEAILHGLRNAAPNDQAGGVAGNTGTGAAVSKADANKIISRVLNAADGRIPGVTFNVVKTKGDPPGDALADIGVTPGAPGTVYGAYKHGVVHLVLDTHQTAEELEKTLVHTNAPS